MVRSVEPGGHTSSAVFLNSNMLTHPARALQIVDATRALTTANRPRRRLSLWGVANESAAGWTAPTVCPSVEPGGRTAFRGKPNSSMLIHPARGAGAPGPIQHSSGVCVDAAPSGSGGTAVLKACSAG